MDTTTDSSFDLRGEETLGQMRCRMPVCGVLCAHLHIVLFCSVVAVRSVRPGLLASNVNVLYKRYSGDRGRKSK